MLNAAISAGSSDTSIWMKLGIRGTRNATNISAADTAPSTAVTAMLLVLIRRFVIVLVWLFIFSTTFQIFPQRPSAKAPRRVWAKQISQKEIRIIRNHCLGAVYGKSQRREADLSRNLLSSGLARLS